MEITGVYGYQIEIAQLNNMPSSVGSAHFECDKSFIDVHIILKIVGT